MIKGTNKNEFFNSSTNNYFKVLVEENSVITLFCQMNLLLLHNYVIFVSLSTAKSQSLTTGNHERPTAFVNTGKCQAPGDKFQPHHVHLPYNRLVNVHVSSLSAQAKVRYGGATTLLCSTYSTCTLYCTVHSTSLAQIGDVPF